MKIASLLRPLSWIVLACAGLLVLVLALALRSRPGVARDAAALDAGDIVRLKQQLVRADPRRAPHARPPEGGAPALQVFRAEGRDVDLLLNDATQRLLHVPSRLTLQDGHALLQASVELSPAFAPFGRWLDIEAALRETGGLPELERLRLGRLPVPATLAEWLLRREIARRGAAPQVDLLLDMVQRVGFAPDRVEVAYVWREDAPDRLRESLLPPGLVPRLQAHAAELARLARKAPEPVALPVLLRPMLAFAGGRCGLDCPPAQLTEEYRAALIVMALHASGQPLSRIVPQARDWPRAPARQVTLRGRGDFAMHFLISAVLAAEGGGRLADAIGMYKEVADSRDGSGFSFNDLAADRAGTRFGQIVVHDPGRLRAAAGRDALPEDDFMPTVADLPEFMPQAEFQARYGGIGAPAYRRMMADIEQRVMSRPLLR
ncbi:hypothetical protein [Sphaerotilus uruguayifluvii]|uniref:Uncharacterized protein n=1 Tax=Sphaerotilus uruguayifluvii TaxID=2735897 RepID=A0ABX2FZ00_9BURK|nr:hypothetical protein [Leptothrix sp. C29]NRT54459.1 hypothetical protein [Leptothrix sp. C29]